MTYYHAFRTEPHEAPLRMSIIVGPTSTPGIPARYHDVHLDIDGTDYTWDHVATWDHEPTDDDRTAAGLNDDEEEPPGEAPVS
jgi:hypothetical protein